MKTKFSLIVVFFITSLSALAQTWSDDVAEIFYEKCTKCHNPGGVAPFSLMTYSESSTMAAAIYDAVALDKMPPWPPSNTYQQYVHNRSLSATQKTTVLNWLTNGVLEGNSANTPPPPVYNSGSILGNGDLTVQIPNYTSKATATQDDYVCFVMPNGLAAGRKIRAVEIVPGNREIVHHCLIYVDASNASVTDTIGGDCASPGATDAKLIMGYTPGSSPLTLPSSGPLKLGMDMPANASIVFAMHYPAGSFGELDSTKVIFHFYPPGETNIRNVGAERILENWSFALPPNQLTPVNAQYPPSGGSLTNISLLSVFPHMHLLGKSIKVFGLDANDDTLKLIDIPHWDFHWQDFYFFKNIVKAPIGSRLKLNAVYDNTVGNLHNPNYPPITVYPGLNTADEMCLAYFHFMAYQAGDENYDMEVLMNEETASILELSQEKKELRIFPNPFESRTEIEIENLKIGDALSIAVYDFAGKHIKTILTTQNYQQESIFWDGTNDLNQPVSKGMYYLSIRHKDKLLSSPVMKF